MTTRRSPYGWMALGGLLCLFGVVLTCKLRDGNRAFAQTDFVGPVLEKKEPLPEPLPAPKVDTAEPPHLPPLPEAPAVPATESRPTTAEPPLIQVTGANLPDVPTPPTVMPAVGPASGSDQRPIVIPASATVTTVGTAPPMPPAPPAPAPAAAPVVIPPVAGAAVTAPPPGQPLPPLHVEPAPVPAVPSVPPGTPPAPPAVPVPPVVTPVPPVVTPVPPVPPVAPTVVPAVVPPTAPSAPTEPKVIKTAAQSTISIPDSEAVQPLPPLRGRLVSRPKSVLPLTGTFVTTLTDQKAMLLPPSIHEQLGNNATLLVSPGSDRCLWLTNQAHLDRLQTKLDKSPARESDVRGFKRLYYAQTVKVPVKDGRLLISDRLVQFAGLGQELVLVGIDDHFEVWDATRWRRYTQTKKAREVTEE